MAVSTVDGDEMTQRNVLSHTDTSPGRTLGPLDLWFWSGSTLCSVQLIVCQMMFADDVQ